MNPRLLGALLISACFILPARAQSAETLLLVESQAIERAALDYIDALYLVGPSRLERSVHPPLAKRGYLPQEFGVYPKVSAEDLLEHFADQA